MSPPRVAVVQHAEHVPLGLLGPALGGVEIVLVRPDLGEALPALDHADALIVLGGTMSAYDDLAAPWLPAVRDLLAAAVGTGTPTLGVCLGAQLLAVALGGEVEVAAPGGPERGVIEVRLRPDSSADALLGPVEHRLGRTIVAPSSHDDAVSVLPPGATWLASSRAYPFQAFRVGSAWGLQFHPEADAGTAADWARRAGLDPEVARAEHTARAAELGSLADAVGAAFADLARERAAARAG